MTEEAARTTRPTEVFRAVAALERHAFRDEVPGLSAVTLAASAQPIEPILVFTEFHMERPIFGPHPHAGISVMTYLLPDSQGHFRNRDSLGDDSEILPGGVHITQAGRGVHHDEVPLPSGVDAHGFQIWINHREADRWVAPRAMHAHPDALPEVRDGGAVVRVVLGHYAGQAAPYALVTDVTILHVRLAAGASLTLPATTMAFAYGVSGATQIGAHTLPAQGAAHFAAGETPCQLTGGPTGGELLFVTARPLGEPIVYGGPFVMTTTAQLRETQQRYARGEMGSLPPLRGR